MKYRGHVFSHTTHMVYTRRIVVQPASEVVSLAELKAQTRVPEDLSQDDTKLAAFGTAARQYVEQITNRQLVTATWDVFLDCFPYDCEIKLPLGALQAVESFSYTDSADSATAWAQTGNNLLSGSTVVANIDFDSELARIVLPYSGTWPSATLRTVNPVAIRIVCGYGPFTGTVNTVGTAVTWASGAKFSRAWRAGKSITIGGTAYEIASVTSRTALTLTASAGTQTGIEYETDDAVPEPLKQAILLMAAHFYENREAVVLGKAVAIESKPLAKAFDTLVAPYRLYSFG